MDALLLLRNLCCYEWLGEYDSHPSYEERIEGF